VGLQGRDKMRSMWKGSISFGLVNIPVRLYPASRARELKFRLLHKKDLSEVRYARICKSDGKEIPWADIVKGYEFKGGEYVVLTDEDFERANLKKTKTIEILSFAEQDEIDSIFFDTPYYLEPEKGSGKAYHLLIEALEQSKKVAIGKFVFKNHEHLGVIKAYEGILVLNQMRYLSELIPAKDLNIRSEQKASKAELTMALELIDHLTKAFNPSEYFDTYTEEVKEIIEEKAKGKKIRVKKGQEPKTPKVHDIMALLKESVQKQKKKPKAKRRAA
jgi:DNA end-binding protein Ku